MSAVALTVDVLRSFHDAGPAPHTAEGAGPAGRSGGATPPPDPIGPPVAIPGPATPEPLDLLTTLRRRRAIRFFATTPIPAAPLRAVVEAGLAADARRWPGEDTCCPLVPVVVAQHVDGLAPAAYVLDGGHAVPVMALGDPESYQALTLQREFADAGAIVSLLGDLEHAERAHGGAGYRTLMTRAGAAAYQMWLAALAHDLAGSVFAGFLPAAVRQPLRCDGTSRHQLFALALGNPGAAIPDTAVVPAAASADATTPAPAAQPERR